MSKLDDMLAKADEVLALDEKATAGPWESRQRDYRHICRIEAVAEANRRAQEYVRDTLSAPRTFAANVARSKPDDAILIASYRTAAPDLARALKAVAEALDEAEQSRWGPVPHPLRAAIERRLTEGK